MDEDIEIVSEDEDNGTPMSEDSPHLKPKAKDKKHVIYISLVAIPFKHMLCDISLVARVLEALKF
jgi:hypothetical protein